MTQVSRVNWGPIARLRAQTLGVLKAVVTSQAAHFLVGIVDINQPIFVVDFDVVTKGFLQIILQRQFAVLVRRTKVQIAPFSGRFIGLKGKRKRDRVASTAVDRLGCGGLGMLRSSLLISWV